MSEEHLCVRCARLGPTCCQSCQIYVGPGDAERISQYVGEPVEAFADFRYPDDPIYLTAHDDDPIWPRTVIREDGHRRVLNRRENGDCTFLGPTGCRLPLEVRPLVCRLYPYDYNQAGIKPRLASGCPVQLLPPGRSLLQELDMNLADAERWHRMLYDEILREPHARLDDLPPGVLPANGATNAATNAPAGEASGAGNGTSDAAAAAATEKG
ncbi:MAG TPA: hypothetical protein DCQ98_17550 [Planctomycetaceae bacterium]|nr:hypothetical protein [Planctomycetaceae bacterium]HRE99584.1 YkgJ family cysteine cluster protein [Pirellulaceae bacterium]